MVHMVACKHMYFFGLILCPSTLSCSPQLNARSLQVGRLFCFKLEKPVCFKLEKPSYTRSCLPKPQSQSSLNGSDGADIPGLVAGWGRRFSAFGFRLFRPYSLWFLAGTQTSSSAVRRKKKKSSSCRGEIPLSHLQPSPDGGWERSPPFSTPLPSTQEMWAFLH